MDHGKKTPWHGRLARDRSGGRRAFVRFYQLSFRRGQGIIADMTITIDDKLGDRIRQAYRIAESADRSITGIIVEVNADSDTFVIRDKVSKRQITCDVGWKIFEQYDWTVRMQVRVRGQYIKRGRRDNPRFEKLWKASGPDHPEL